MRLSRRLFDNALVRGAIAILAAGYIRLVHRTTRWTAHGRDNLTGLLDAGGPVIGCFWHGRLLLMRYCWPPERPIRILVSEHRDGRLIADTIARLGVGTIDGSTRHGGAAALLAMRRVLRAGESVGITPDGPRGPRMRVAPGIVRLASSTGAPVLPAAFATTRRRVLGSWDRFTLALPFGRGVWVYGEPLQVPPGIAGEALETTRRELETRMNRVTAEADRLCGQTPIEPAAPAAPAAPVAPVAPVAPETTP